MVELVEQAPCSFAGAGPPVNSVGLVGIRVVSQSGTGYFRVGRTIVAMHPTTGKPIYPTPRSAGPIDDHVPTTSKQTGDHPAPIPRVGIISPQAGSAVNSADDSTPNSSGSSWGVGIFIGLIVFVLFFAGASFRRFL